MRNQMTTLTKCDLCEKEGVDKITVGSKTILTISKDVCEEHLLVCKKFIHFLTGQSYLPLVIEDIKVVGVEDATPTNN